MQLTQADLRRATRAHIISEEQADTLWAFFQKHRQAPRAIVEENTVNYWLAGMAAVAAMVGAMYYAWSDGWGAVVLGSAYVCIAAWFGEKLLREHKMEGTAALVLILGIAFVPTALFGFIQGIEMWVPGAPYHDYYNLFDGRWLAMECGTLAVAIAALFYYRIPLLALPILCTLYFLVVDIAPALRGDHMHHALKLSVAFGVLCGIVALAVDFRWRRDPDFGRWVHAFGAFAIGGALALSSARGELPLGAVAGFGLVLAAWGGLFARGSYALAGVLAFFGATVLLARMELKSSSMASLVGFALALVTVALVVAWRRQREAMAAWRVQVLPHWLRRTLGSSAESA